MDKCRSFELTVPSAQLGVQSLCDWRIVYTSLLFGPIASLLKRQGAADSDPRRIRVALAFPTLRIFKRRSGIRVMPLKAMTFGPDLGLTVDFFISPPRWPLQSSSPAASRRMFSAATGSSLGNV
jgi:hypothetical protein